MVSTEKIFDITTPQRSDLCCLIFKIINFEHNLIYSKFCAKMLKCREFLRETPQAIAAPITNRKILLAGGSIYIIITKEFFESCTFQNHCNALNIQMIDILEPIPTYIYKACLLYTMEYKLAPQWNKVGPYLVEGQDFLSMTENINAVMLNIKMINGNSAQLLIKTVNLKIPFLRMTKTHSLQYDLQTPVCVLPSMKMASVLRTSKTVKYPFKNYEDLRAYWKNMHGYILPDYEDGFVFYDIEFLFFKSNVFLYPEICLTSGPLQILPSVMDPLPRIFKFIGDLTRKVAKLCEQQLDICMTNMFQTTVLTCTPVLPRVRLPAYDTGYGTQSRKMNTGTPLVPISDICNTPTKKTRLSLSRIDNSLTCTTEINDFDLDVKPSSTKDFNKIKVAASISTLLRNTDDDIISNPIVMKEESKSRYFTSEKQESENESIMELTGKEEKRDKLNLKEKLTRNF